MSGRTFVRTLAGRRILLTRSEEDCAVWAAEIEGLGAVPVTFPCIECHDIDTPELRAHLAAELPRARWLAFTSRRGVAAFARLFARIYHQLSAAGADPCAVAGRTPSRHFDSAQALVSTTPSASLGPCGQPQRRLGALATKVGDISGLDGGRGPGEAPGALPDEVRVAAVGPATARAAAAAFGRVDLAGGPGGTAAALAAALGPELGSCDRVLAAVAENAGRVLEETVRSAGRTCTRLDVYRTLPVPERARKQAASTLGADDVFLASPSAVAGFVNQVRLDSAPGIFTIGPSTTQAARAAGLDVTGEAPRPGLGGLLEALRCVT